MGFNMPAVTRSDFGEREDAFERLVAAEAGRLYRLALAVVDDPGEAEDAVQETLLTAWRHRSSLSALANPSAWLTRVCVRQCLRRRRKLRRWILWSSDQWSAAAPQIPDLEGRLIDLERAYRRLTRSQRAVVTLHMRDGLTVDACAALLGIRPGTARSHLGRAVKKLRKELTHA